MVSCVNLGLEQLYMGAFPTLTLWECTSPALKISKNLGQTALVSHNKL